VSSRRISIALIAAAALGTSLLGAAPAQAKAVVITPAWSPFDPPADVNALATQVLGSVYGLSCGDVSATGWSGDAGDDVANGWKTSVFTTLEMTSACSTMTARQGTGTSVAFFSRADVSAGVGIAGMVKDAAVIDWDFVPKPRVGQWVGIAARAADGAALPMLQLRIAKVGTDTFTVDSPVSAAYLGAPVVDNVGRALGMVTAAGTVVTGAPKFCPVLFICADAARVWWNITAPSGVRDLTATPGKGKVAFTWKRAASDGGAFATYWFRVNEGEWKRATNFQVTVDVPKGKRVTVTVGTQNAAGWGPVIALTARAR